jgi:hypothetical protein
VGDIAALTASSSLLASCYKDDSSSCDHDCLSKAKKDDRQRSDDLVVLSIRAADNQVEAFRSLMRTPPFIRSHCNELCDQKPLPRPPPRPLPLARPLSNAWPPFPRPMPGFLPRGFGASSISRESSGKESKRQRSGRLRLAIHGQERSVTRAIHLVACNTGCCFLGLPESRAKR